MQYLLTDATAQRLLPGRAAGLSVVLFWRDDGLENREALRRYQRLPWPEHCALAVLDVDHARETAMWFGIQETPALVAIRDGAILALECGCTEETCWRLLDCADRQHALIMKEQ